ncbi:MAG TPA: YggT family protein [Candidatus Saccharimonadales bacterium]|nr:YggT family protein [Candidatus Saccharimonadales bacterium]
MTHPRDITLKLGHVFVALAEAVLAVRVVFSLVNADTTNGVVRWFYDMSEPLLQPIRGVFPSVEYPNAYVLELPVIFAMVGYAVFGYLVVLLVNKNPNPKVLADFKIKEALKNRLK